MVPGGMPCTNCRREGDVCEPRHRQQKQKRNQLLAHSAPDQAAFSLSLVDHTEGESHSLPLFEVSLWLYAALNDLVLTTFLANSNLCSPTA